MCIRDRAYTVLNKLGVTAEAYEKLIRERIGTGEPTSLSPDEFTPRTKRILQVAAVAGAQLHNAYVGTEHLLIAIIEDGQSYAMRFLQILGADPNRIVAELSNMLNNTGFHKQNEARPGGGEEGGQTGKALEQFGRDLTQLAAQGKIDPVIGRQNEIERVIQILCRRTKNNPCLLYTSPLFYSTSPAGSSSPSACSPPAKRADGPGAAKLGRLPAVLKCVAGAADGILAKCLPVCHSLLERRGTLDTAGSGIRPAQARPMGGRHRDRGRRDAGLPGDAPLPAASRR